MLLFHRDLGGAGRPPLVILHGLLGSSRNWQTAGREFADRFHVLARQETLVVTIDADRIVIKGYELSPVRAALNLGRLAEVRQPSAAGCRCAGTRIDSVQIEVAHVAGQR